MMYVDCLVKKQRIWYIAFYAGARTLPDRHQPGAKFSSCIFNVFKKNKTKYLILVKCISCRVMFFCRIVYSIYLNKNDVSNYFYVDHLETSIFS